MYKRQDFSIFIASDEPYEKIAEAAKSVSEIDKVVGEEVKYETLAAKQEKAEADAAAAEKSQDAPAAVSYTHLDVYKRQPLI